MAHFPFTPADEIHDLDRIAGLDDRGVVAGTLDDREIVLDGNAAGIDVELGEQRADAQRARNVTRFAVDAYGQSLPQR